MDDKVVTFLTFFGQADEAMSFYVSLFEPAEVIAVERYGPDELGAEGSVKVATFSLHGRLFMCIDSNVAHEWAFTPAMSLYVACDSDEEIDRLYEQLAAGGQVFMPLGAYPFSRKYVWLADRFGVSWQLSLRGD